jgi:hypothetical protein
MFGKWRRDELAEKRRSNETAIPALLGMSKCFLAIIVMALGALVGLFAFVALTLEAASHGG